MEARLQERGAGPANQKVHIPVLANAITVQAAKMVAKAQEIQDRCFITIQQHNGMFFNDTYRSDVAGSPSWPHPRRPRTHSDTRGQVADRGLRCRPISDHRSPLLGEGESEVFTQKESLSARSEAMNLQRM